MRDLFRLTFGMCRILGLGVSIFLSAGNSVATKAENVLVFGDSLSDEYAFMPFSESDNPDWRARNWVEILAEVREEDLGFGEYREDPWDAVRREGFEYNWAVPGMTAAQLRMLLSDPEFAGEREMLDEQIDGHVDRAVVMIGVNDFYNTYSSIYEGSDGGALGERVNEDIEFIVSYLKSVNGRLAIAVANIPDPGATPRVVERYPDPAGRKRVEGAIREANEGIQTMVGEKGLALIDLFSVSIRLIEGTPFLVDGLDILERGHPDNHPNFLFTRDDFHPGTVAHGVYANQVIEAINLEWEGGVESIEEASILALAGLPVEESFEEWIRHFRVGDSGLDATPGGDGIPNAVKYVLGLNPERNENGRFPEAETVFNENGEMTLEVTYRPRRDENGRFSLSPRYSEDFFNWEDVPPQQKEVGGDGSIRAFMPLANGRGFMRFRVIIEEP